MKKLTLNEKKWLWNYLIYHQEKYNSDKGNPENFEYCEKILNKMENPFNEKTI